MPLSYATYTGNSGSPQSSFNIPYSYILKDHIKVYYGRDILANTQTALLVNGTDYNFTADNTIQLIGSTLNSGTTTGNPHNLANGVVLSIERDTPDSSQIVEFADGSNLIGDNLNNANLQNLFVVQEQQDKNDLSAAKAISSESASTTATNNVATLSASQFNKDGSVAMTGDINANSNKIKNLADPTNAQDGVTKAYLERSGSITSTQIADGTIVDGDINASANIAGSKLQAVSGSNPGSMSSADKTKLDTIETSAKDDQTGAEIKSLYEGENNTNAFTDAEKSKLQNIESNAKDDQTGAEIKGLYEGENNTNAFTDAEQTKLSNLDLTKLQNIEVNATQDQTDSEIKTAYENNANTNAFTDTEKSKLQGIENNAKDDQTASEIKTLYESNNNTNPLTDAEKAVIDGVTANTSELNKLDGFTGSVTDLNEVVTGKNVVEQITGSATDAQIPTAQAVNERVVELVTEVGGFHPIANESSFPTTNPDINDGAGTIVSLKALTSSFSTGSGVTTHTFTNGAGSGNNVTINGLPSNTTFQAGKGLLLETTTTLHTYTYHRLVLDESGVSNADALVASFNERYYGALSSNPATRPSGANRQNGDLYFNQSDGKMKVYNGSHASGTWDDVAAPGNFFINTLSSSSNSGGGSATFNGTATRFTLSNPPNEAQQLLVSINGVIQKPNAGTSPSEGFAISGADIIFASAPPSGASYFIVTIGSSVNIGTPSDNTVTSAKIVDGSIVNADISNSANIAGSKLADGAIVADKIAGLAVGTGKIADGAITGPKISDATINLSKLEHGTSSTDGKFLRANNGADPTFESLPASGVTVSNNANNRLVTGDGTNLVAESELQWDGSNLLARAGEGGSASLNLIADEGDDNGDGWKIQSEQDENDLTFKSNISGSYVDKLKLKNSGQLEVQGNLEVAGDIVVPDAMVHSGDADTKIRFPADNTISMRVAGSELLRITPTDAVNNEPNIRLKANITVDGAAVQTGGQKVDTVGIPKGQLNVADHQAFDVTDNGGAIAFSAKYHSNGSFTTMGSIEGVKNNNSSGDYGGNLVFKTRSNGGHNNIGMRLTNNGLCFGTDNAAANALDEYEEGSWTPGGHWTTINAQYIKIGRMVYASFSIRADTTGSSNVEITGLPFTAHNSKSGQGGVAWGLCEFASTGNWLGGFVDENTTTGKIVRGGQNLTFGSGNNNMNNSAFLRGTFIYYAAS